MSVGVVAFVTVETDEGDLAPLVTEIQLLLANASMSDFAAAGSRCEFQLRGENDVDYEPLERLAEFLKLRVTTFSINAQEFVERDGGFYCDSDGEGNG